MFLSNAKSATGFIHFFTLILSNFNVKEQVFVLLSIYHVSLHNGNIIQYGYQ